MRARLLRKCAHAHSGGAGTTAASLREGLTTLIKPFCASQLAFKAGLTHTVGDQTFWSQRVQKLGAGLRVASLSANDLSEALTKAANDTFVRGLSTTLTNAV